MSVIAASQVREQFPGAVGRNRNGAAFPDAPFPRGPVLYCVSVKANGAVDFSKRNFMQLHPFPQSANFEFGNPRNILIRQKLPHHSPPCHFLSRPVATRVLQRINREKKKPEHEKYHVFIFFAKIRQKKAAIPWGMAAIGGKRLFTLSCFFSQRRF
jgi:hypothetical protein